MSSCLCLAGHCVLLWLLHQESIRLLISSKLAMCHQVNEGRICTPVALFEREDRIAIHKQMMHEDCYVLRLGLFIFPL